jgi:hypothetical protein
MIIIGLPLNSEASVRPVASLKKQFDSYLLRHPIETSASLSDVGLVVGAGTPLMRMEESAAGPKLSIARDEARLFALLAVSFDRPPPSDILHHLEGASKHWQQGDKALANIRLAFARLPQLESETQAWSLHLAAAMLDDGLSPGQLLRELGYPPSPSGFQKFDPNQPRVPAGSGRNSGQWTSDGGTDSTEVGDSHSASRPVIVPTGAGIVAGSTADVSLSIGTLAEGLFESASDSAFLEGLAALSDTVGADVVLGATMFPVPTSGTSEGSVPGDSQLRYSLNLDEGVLRLLHDGVGGQEIAAAARLGRDGIFFETETGTPIARLVGSSLVFDAQSLASVQGEDESQAGAETNATSELDTPQLCPDPGPDVPHGASPRSVAYQAYISALNNPQRPLPPGLAVSLINPNTGRRVTYDDCREVDGTMIEAKAPGFSHMLGDSYLRGVLEGRWTQQATRQVDAAGWHTLDWYFAEESAALYASRLFKDHEGLQDIQIIYQPPSSGGTQ